MNQPTPTLLSEERLAEMRKYAEKMQEFKLQYPGLANDTLPNDFIDLLAHIEAQQAATEPLPSTVARINYDPGTGQWYLWEYGLQQQSGFDSIQQLADYLRDYPTQLLQKL